MKNYVLILLLLPINLFSNNDAAIQYGRVMPDRVVRYTNTNEDSPQYGSLQKGTIVKITNDYTGKSIDENWVHTTTIQGAGYSGWIKKDQIDIINYNQLTLNEISLINPKDRQQGDYVIKNNNSIIYFDTKYNSSNTKTKEDNYDLSLKVIPNCTRIEIEYNNKIIFNTSLEDSNTVHKISFKLLEKNKTLEPGDNLYYIRCFKNDDLYVKEFILEYSKPGYFSQRDIVKNIINFNMPKSIEELSNTYGIPEQIDSKEMTNRHDPDLTDTHYYIRYKGLELHGMTVSSKDHFIIRKQKVYDSNVEIPHKIKVGNSYNEVLKKIKVDTLEVGIDLSLNEFEPIGISQKELTPDIKVINLYEFMRSVELKFDKDVLVEVNWKAYSS